MKKYVIIIFPFFACKELLVDHYFRINIKKEQYRDAYDGDPLQVHDTRRLLYVPYFWWTFFSSPPFLFKEFECWESFVWQSSSDPRRLRKRLASRDGCK